MAFDVGGLRENWQTQFKNMAHGVCMCVFADSFKHYTLSTSIKS